MRALVISVIYNFKSKIRLHLNESYNESEEKNSITPEFGRNFSNADKNSNKADIDTF